MKKRIILFTILSLALIKAFGQENKSSFLSRFQMGIGYSNVSVFFPKQYVFIDMQYELNDFLSPDLVYMHSVEVNSSEHADKTSVGGLGLKLHIMPLFLRKVDYSRVDIYIKPSVEYLYSTSYSTVNNANTSSDSFEWEKSKYSKVYFSTGLGIVYYPWKRVGFSAGYTGFWLHEQLDSRFALGLRLRF